jgi:ribulose 1,5-bisphosphate synthetase/thiazole synthase
MMSRTSHTSLIILALSVLIQSSLQAWTDATLKCSASDILASYDYIIIGGGTSGLTVADRLTEDPSSKLL